MAKQFDMNDLSEGSYVLEIQIMWDRKNKCIVLSQALYIDKILLKYVMEDSNKGFLPF